MEGDGDAIARLTAEVEAARAALRDAEERYELLANNAHAVLSRIDAKGRVTYVSPSIRQVLGFDPEEIVGQDAFAFLNPQELEARRAGFAEALRTGAAPTVTARARRKDGTYVWMEYTTDVLRDAGGAVAGFQSTSHDVTERHEAEEALRRSEEHFEEFIRAMPVPAVIHRDARFVLINRAFTEVFGYAEADLLGASVLSIVDVPHRAYVEHHMQSRPEERAGVRTREHALAHKDGSRIPVEVTSVPIFLRGELCPMGVIDDLRERKRLEAQLVTADRLSALGRLSAAVGHEINNPLAYVLGSLELIDRELGHVALEPERARQLHELLANVREGAERIRAIVVDLRALSRESVESLEPVDLGHVLDLCAAMADHEVHHRARLVKAYHDVPFVLGSEARLGQVFLNLLVNAGQAIPEGDVEGNQVRLEVHPADPGMIAVEVVDSGVGIPAEHASRIFEPFFTTKAGEGTGLGLSISRHIVSSLGGSITATPNAPRGSRFRVVLPCVAEAPESDRAGGAVEEAPAAPEDGARFLVVDDEPQLAHLVARLLRRPDVAVALGGQEAIDRLEADERFDVILCDLHMNGVSGMDLHDYVQRHLGGLEARMIFMTGGALDTRAREFSARSGRPVLDKPIDVRALEAAIADVLGAAVSAPAS